MSKVLKNQGQSNISQKYKSDRMANRFFDHSNSIKNCPYKYQKQNTGSQIKNDNR